MTNFALAECNSDHAQENGLLTHTFSERRYTPLSSYLKIAVPRLLSSPLDLGLFSTQMETLLDTPELIHEFGGSIHNVLRVCDFSALRSKQAALDLTQDFGATSEFLSTKFKHVDSLKIDPKRSELSRQRFPDQGNIYFHTTHPEDLNYPSNRYDFIYLGRLEDLELNIQETTLLLSKLKSSLSENGVMVVNIKNRERLAKWLNTSRHHLDPLTPYQALYSNECMNLFSSDELAQCLSDLNFVGTNMSASYSANDGLPNLLSKSYLDNNPNAINHFYRIGSVRNSEINEYLLYKAELASGTSLFNRASRILALCDNDGLAAKSLYDRDFCHFPGSSRLPKWRTITSKKHASSTVIKTPITQQDSAVNTAHNGVLRQNLDDQSFATGRLLIDGWLEAILAKDAKSFSSLIATYFGWLSSRMASNIKNQIQPDSYDLLPFNIVCEDDHFFDQDAYRVIDPEWLLERDISPEFVLFRALFWFAFENRSLLADFGDCWGFHSIDAFVRHYLTEAGCDETVAQYIKLEERIQKEISEQFKSGSIQHAMHHRFVGNEKTAFPHNVCQITWADAQNHFDNAQTINIDWAIDNSRWQTLSSKFKLTDSTKTILRVDPMQREGLFQINNLKLLDANKKIVWEITGIKGIMDSCHLENLRLTTAQNQDFFIATNEDPFFLFDLGKKQKLEEIDAIELEIRLIDEPNYQEALRHLLGVVDSQAASIVRLGNKSHESRADIELLQQELTNANNALVHKKNELIHQSKQLSQLDQLINDNRQLREALEQRQRPLLLRLVKRLRRMLTQA